MAKRIFRSERDKMIGGVCSGLARYFSIDVVLIRLLWVLLVFLQGSGVFAYIIAWIIIPSEDNIRTGSSTQDSEDYWVEEENGNGSGLLGQGSKVAGLILIAAGFFFLMEMYIPTFYWRRLWPLVLIIVGIFIVVQGTKGEEK